jgi:transglutaminase-like putative cysteine protease
MDRRHFLAATASVAGLSGLPHAGAARAASSIAGAPMPPAASLVPPGAGAAATTTPPVSGGWRTFEVVTSVELWPQDLPLKLWVPLPLYGDTPWQRTLDVSWACNGATTGMFRDPKFGAPAFFASWNGKEGAPSLRLTTVVMTRNRKVDLARPGPAVPAPDMATWLEPTPHIPLDGIVRATASRIVPLAGGNVLARAQAIYDWIVENTFRDPKVIGCGTGDIRFMLESGNLGGKCADLSALFVGLARSAGIPARDVYGIRVADSATWKSLGKSGDVTRAQHCRAEFHHPNFGWVPVDPADVRKVVLEEAGTPLALSDARVDLARKTLFGAWEMNWVAYNTANDLRLPPQADVRLGHFMYPYAEGRRGALDYYDPQDFRYSIVARERTA